MKFKIFVAKTCVMPNLLTWQGIILGRRKDKRFMWAKKGV
jgi:hypothetical protein